LAEQVPPGAQGLVCLPYFQGQRSPEFNPQARGVFYGWSMAHTRGHMLRAILESYGYGILHSLEVGVPGWRDSIRRVVASGGGAASPLWRQIVSDIVGVRQEYVAGAEASLGAAYLAGYAVGLVPDFEGLCRGWVEVNGVTEPDATRHRAYRPYYGLYRDLHDDLRARQRGAAGSS